MDFVTGLPLSEGKLCCPLHNATMGMHDVNCDIITNSVLHVNMDTWMHFRSCLRKIIYYSYLKGCLHADERPKRRGKCLFCEMSPLVWTEGKSDPGAAHIIVSSQLGMQFIRAVVISVQNMHVSPLMDVMTSERGLSTRV